MQEYSRSDTKSQSREVKKVRRSRGFLCCSRSWAAWFVYAVCLCIPFWDERLRNRVPFVNKASRTRNLHHTHSGARNKEAKNIHCEIFLYVMIIML